MWRAENLRNMRAPWILAVTLMVGSCAEDSSSAPGVIAGSRVNAVLGGEAAAGFLRAEGEHAFSFPRDHGVHDGFRSEWWYLSAVLRDAAGDEYGVQFTMFRQGLAPQPTGEGPWHTAQAYLGHFAVTDVTRRIHTHAQRVARGHPRLAGVDLGPGFRAYIEDWELAGDADQHFTLTVRDAPHGIGADLRMEQVLPIVLQGERGLSRKSATGASYYYSMPRLRVAGSLVLGNRRIEVEGLAWMDREWSTSVLSDDQAGWDWFALHLEDGRSVMVYRLRHRDGRRDAFDRGMVIQDDSAVQGDVVSAQHAGVRALHPDDFALRPRRDWRDANGAAWPVQWQLAIGDESFTIRAMVNDQVMDTGLIYWEGIVAVEDAAGHSMGRGYMELTGYGGDSDDG